MVDCMSREMFLLRKMASVFFPPLIKTMQKRRLEFYGEGRSEEFIRGYQLALETIVITYDKIMYKEKEKCQKMK